MHMLLAPSSSATLLWMMPSLLHLLQVKELGRGCFGSVWLQKWRGVDVAVKEMLQSGNDTSPAEVRAETPYQTSHASCHMLPCFSQQPHSLSAGTTPLCSRAS
jgi:hypothetical protein